MSDEQPWTDVGGRDGQPLGGLPPVAEDLGSEGATCVPTRQPVVVERPELIKGVEQAVQPVLSVFHAEDFEPLLDVGADELSLV